MTEGKRDKNQVVYYFDVNHFVCCSFDAYNIEIRHKNVESFKWGHRMSMFLQSIHKLGKHTFYHKWNSIDKHLVVELNEQ